MANYSSAYRQRLYFLNQTVNAFRTAPSSLTSAQPILYEAANMTPNGQLINPPYKAGSASRLSGTRGRQAGSFTYSGPLMPSGAAGTKQNLDPLWVSMTGQAGTVVAGTSVTYSATDATIPLFAVKFDEVAGLTNQYMLGGLPTSVRVRLSGDAATVSADFQCVGIGDSDSFSSYAGSIDANLAGGLSSFPTEPTGATIVGSTIPGFGVTVSIDGNAMSEVRGGLEIEFATGYQFIDDGVADAYRLIALNGSRVASLSSLTILNSDRASLINLKQKARLKTPMTVIIVSQATAGVIQTFTMRNVQFPESAFAEDGAAVNVNFGGAAAHASGFGQTDDYTYAQT